MKAWKTPHVYTILLLACINLYRLLVWLKQHILNLINRLRSWDWLIEFWCLITNSKKIIDDCTIHTRLETNHWVFTIAEMVQRRTGKIFKQSRASQEQLQLRSRSLLTHSLTHSLTRPVGKPTVLSGKMVMAPVLMLTVGLWAVATYRAIAFSNLSRIWVPLNQRCSSVAWRWDVI